MASLEKCLFRSFPPFGVRLFVFLVLTCMSYFFILETNPLSVFSFAIIFSHSVLSFHLACSFLCCTKAFKLNHLNLFTFCLYFHYSRRWDVKELALIYAIEYVITVSGLTFRYFIHLKFIFVYGVRRCSMFILLHALCSFPSTIYWRGCFCPIVYSFLLCQK